PGKQLPVAGGEEHEIGELRRVTSNIHPGVPDPQDEHVLGVEHVGLEVRVGMERGASEQIGNVRLAVVPIGDQHTAIGPPAVPGRHRPAARSRPTRAGQRFARSSGALKLIRSVRWKWSAKLWMYCATSVW